MKKVLICLFILSFTTLSLQAQEYVGDEACAGCHANFPAADFFDNYKLTGHPWKIYHTAGDTPDGDTWPHTPVPPLPVVEGEELGWGDVEYTIGNFYWKTRYMDREGYIYTGLEGELTQWNLINEEWVNYNAGEVRPFNCGRCHTTGYDAEGDSQHGLPGIVGSWEEDAIRCEACHGPSSLHVENTSTPPPGGKDCSECHYRDSEFRMPWSGGFMKHHQQGEDLSHSPHDAMTCMSCHNPHRSTVYNDEGLIASCSQCHPGSEDNGYYSVQGMGDLSCKDCHMPRMGKSANIIGTYEADVRGHLFSIMTEPIAAADNVYDVDGSLFWNQDDDGNAEVTLDYACLACHDDMSLAEAADFAENIHTEHQSVSSAPEVPVTLHIDSVYPNPFNPMTTLNITIDKPYIVRINLYDMTGRMVQDVFSGPRTPGSHTFEVDGRNLATGIYFLNVIAGSESAQTKIMLVK